MPETVRVIVKKPKGSGRRLGWNKLVRRVDPAKSGGHCFEGEFLDEHQVDLGVGSVLVGQVPVGSAKSGHHWRVGTATKAGVEWEDRTWPLDRFLDFRDHVQNLLRGDNRGVEALREERAQLLERLHEIDQQIRQSEQG